MLAAPEFYRVDMATTTRDVNNKVTGHLYSPYSEIRGVEKTGADELAAKLKALGLAGRIVHLDGTPEGTVLESFGDVDEMAQMEQTETQNLQAGGLTN